jgi:flavin reductase (DIM6/NTAB) family NADH-FMN oxidoreductase RutF
VAGSEPAFAKLVLGLDEPMFIVTAAAGGERSGCLIGFATQTSIEPERFLVCLSKKNHTHGVALRASHLGVHVVPEDATELAELFGGETGDEVDKFARCAWHEGARGVPLLDACPNRFVGEVVWRRDAGDHDAFLLAPVVAERGTDSNQLDFARAKAIEPGHPATQ